MHQLVNALDMARADMRALGYMEDTDKVIALAERYAAFLLCGEAPSDVIGEPARKRSGTGI